VFLVWYGVFDTHPKSGSYENNFVTYLSSLLLFKRFCDSMAIKKCSSIKYLESEASHWRASSPTVLHLSSLIENFSAFFFSEFIRIKQGLYENQIARKVPVDCANAKRSFNKK